MTNSDEMMTRYLLGELSDAEQTRLEERYFTDAQTFERLVELETELVDSYARGRLSGRMRERFERVYLADPNRRSRLLFGEALAAKVDEIAASRAADRQSVKASSWWKRFSSSLTAGRRALAFSVALLLLLLTSLSVWLFIQSRRLRQDLALTRQGQMTEEQRAREAQQQLADEQAEAKRLAAELERERTGPKPQQTPTASESPAPASTTTAPPVASLVLIASGSRAADTVGAPATLVIHKETEQVRIQLKLKENEYQSYALTLQAVGGREVFSRQHLKPVNTKSGASFVISLPVSKIGAGDYILMLKGLTTNGEVEDVSQSLFRVEKR